MKRTAYNSTLPARTEPMSRGRGLSTRIPLSREEKPAAARTRINPVSDKRRAENRKRRAMAERRFPGMDPECSVKDCPRPADDLHEALTRARGGSITDEDNTFPVCRQHNGELTLEPAWGYEQGLLKHSGKCCEDRRVCSRYEQSGAAA